MKIINNYSRSSLIEKDINSDGVMNSYTVITVTFATDHIKFQNSIFCCSSTLYINYCSER
jgi:hypothetical protein